MNSEAMPPRQPPERGDLMDVLMALEALLDRRVTELNDEVAHYPTPIARCDDQLPHLLEQRGEYVRRLRSVRATSRPDDTSRAAPSVESIAQLLDRYGRPDDGEERDLVASIEAIRQTPQSSIAS